MRIKAVLAWLFGLIWWFSVPMSVVALSGVGAQFSQVSGGVSVLVSGRHSPNAEIVVVDSSGKVVSTAKDEGFGRFSFEFRAQNSQINGLRIFAVDPADETNPVSVPASGLSDELLPPTLVVNPQIETDENDLAVGGYTYPGSSVSLFLEGNNGVFVTEVVEAAGDGGWEFLFVDLEPGTYNLSAVSATESLESFESIELEIVVEPELTGPVGKQAENVGKAVSTVVENVSKVVLPPAVSEAARVVARDVEQVNRAVTPVASVSLIYQVGYWLIQGIIALLQYLGFWKKERSWGVVYDAYTKQPIMLATVRLYSAEQFPRLVETDVTSKLGVFNFAPAAGRYIVRAAKGGYKFPSSLVKTASDGEYSQVYHGEELPIGSDGQLVKMSVPLDPVEVDVSWKFRIMNFLRTRAHLFSVGMLVLGWVLALILMIGGRGGINGLMFVFYSIVLGIHSYLTYRQRKSWGLVVDPKGEPVSGVQLSLMDPQFEKLVQRRVTDSRGKYQFVVPAGVYQIRVENVEWGLVNNKRGYYDGGNFRVEGEKPALIAKKIMVQREG